MTTSDAELHLLIGQWRERMAASPDAWADVDLTFTQLRALFVLGRGPIRVSDLARALGMSLASASALSDRLVRLDLVARRTEPTDRRSVFLHVAPAGLRLLRRLERAQTSQLTRAIRQMSEGERRAFVTTIRAFLRIAPVNDAVRRRTMARRAK
ncbi:MAG: MarR family winged helix-turn-helix transcriptional regulator [Candidatus Limnocylindria bacterium]